MVITIDLTTVIAVGTALTLAGTAALWAFSTLADLRRLRPLIKRVDGDPESDVPKLRDGHAGRLDDVETTVAGLVKFYRAMARELRIPPTSDEHEIADAVRKALAEGRVSGVEPTGSHRAIQIEALPTPAQLARKPTPYRAEAIPREDERPKRR